MCMRACMLSRFSRIQLFVTVWTIVLQAPLSMGFSRQEYWSGLSCPPPRNLPDPGIEPTSALAGGFFTSEPPGKPRQCPSLDGVQKRKHVSRNWKKTSFFCGGEGIVCYQSLHLSSWQFSGAGFLILTFHPKKLGFRKGR